MRHGTTRARHWIAIGGIAALALSACGGDDDGGAEPAPAEADEAGDDTAGDVAAPSGSGGGTLVLGDETITFDSARCFLEEQDAAAGGGKILFVAQAYGTNAAGEELVIDVSRYDEDSQFAGDDISVDIGDPFGDDAISYSARGDIGTVAVDGRSLSADGLTFTDFDAGLEAAGSFEIDC